MKRPLRTAAMSVSILGLAIVTAPLASPGSAGSGVQIITVRYNAPGNDDGSKDNLNSERVFIRNDGDHGVRIRGWKIRDRSRDNVFTIERNIWLKPGDEVHLFTGPGPSGTGDCTEGDCPRSHGMHWYKNHHVWDNGGDTVVLLASDGSVVDRCSYDKADSTPKSCT